MFSFKTQVLEMEDVSAPCPVLFTNSLKNNDQEFFTSPTKRVKFELSPREWIFEPEEIEMGPVDDDPNMNLLDSSATFLLRIKTLTGSETQIRVLSTSYLFDLKEEIESRAGIPVSQQRLIFNGRSLEDNLPLSSFNVNSGSVLHLVLALRGG